MYSAMSAPVYSLVGLGLWSSITSRFYSPTAVGARARTAPNSSNTARRWQPLPLVIVELRRAKRMKGVSKHPSSFQSPCPYCIQVPCWASHGTKKEPRASSPVGRRARRPPLLDTFYPHSFTLASRCGGTSRRPGRSGAAPSTASSWRRSPPNSPAARSIPFFPPAHCPLRVNGYEL